MIEFSYIDLLLALVVLEIFIVRTFQMGLLGMCGCTARAFWG